VVVPNQDHEGAGGIAPGWRSARLRVDPMATSANALRIPLSIRETALDRQWDELMSLCKTEAGPISFAAQQAISKAYRPLVLQYSSPV
jgi:hypothetical protein